MQKIILLTLGIILGVIPSLMAEDAMRTTLSLKESLHMALQKNPSMIFANERVIQSVAKYKLRLAPLLPQITGAVSEARTTKDLRSTGFVLPGEPLVGPNNVFDARVQLTQVLFDAPAFARLQAGRAGQAASIAEQKKAREDVLVLVTHLFIEARRAAESLDVKQTKLRRDYKHLCLVRARLKTGLSSVLDFKKARSSYALSLAQFQNLKAQALESRLDLFSALGMRDYPHVRLIWDDDLLSREIVGDGLVPALQPDIVAEQKNVNLKKEERKEAIYGYFPKIMIFGDYGPSGSSPNNRDFSETYALGVKAVIPIFEGRSQMAKVQETSSQFRISQTQLEDTRRTVGAKIQVSLEILNQAKQALKQKELELDVGMGEWALAWQRYHIGSGHDDALTNASVQLSQMNDQLDEAKAFYFLAKVNLARALGKTEAFLMEE